MKTTDSSDLTDSEGTYLLQHLPADLTRRQWPQHSLRTILDTIFYSLRTGCPWRGHPLGSMLVDTLGVPLSISVTSAGTHDKVGTWRLLAGLKPLVPRMEKIWADGASTSRKLARWCEGYGGWDPESVGRDPEAQGYAVQPRRWVVKPNAL
jgi:transposase